MTSTKRDLSGEVDGNVLQAEAPASDRRKLLRAFVVLAVFGSGSALKMLDKGTFRAVGSMDTVQLIGTGMCFGAAIVALVLFLGNAPSK